MLDTSAQVLTNSYTAVGWRCIAVAECSLVLFFFLYLLYKGRDFVRY